MATESSRINFKIFGPSTTWSLDPLLEYHSQPY